MRCSIKGVQRILVPSVKVRILASQQIFGSLAMNIRRKSVNLICKYYEYDAAMMAAAMEAERTNDDEMLVRIIDGMIAELRELQKDLQPSEPQRIVVRRNVPGRVPKPLGRRPNPDRAQQARNNYIAKRRSQLRKDGYHVERNSMIAYWDEKTRRRRKTEASNIFGFIFKPHPSLKKKS